MTRHARSEPVKKPPTAPVGPPTTPGDLRSLRRALRPAGCVGLPWQLVPRSWPAAARLACGTQDASGIRRRFLHRLSAALLFLAATIAGGATPAAQAQDDPAEARAVASDLDRLRNNTLWAGKPDRVRTNVIALLERRSARADAALRELLLDPRTHVNVVEQIASVTLLVTPHRLLDDTVERLRIDTGTDLERHLESALLHADIDVVARLGELARDVARSVAYRATAVRLLGRTGDAAAFPTVIELWTSPERELRDAARAAFDAIVPGGADTPEDARAFVDGLRRDDVPLIEALRRLLRDRSKPAAAPVAQGAGLQAYTDLALAMLPKATLDQLLHLYVLGSPDPQVRAAAVERLATYAYDDSSDPDSRVRAARALFLALRREDASVVERAIIGTLAALAPAVRGSVDTEELDAVLARVRPAGSVPRETRLLATRLVGELRDERGVPALEEAYRGLADGDAEARLAILDALQEIPVDRTAWLVESVRGERQPRILRKLVVLLGRSRSPASVAAFAALLGDTTNTDADTRRETAQALAAVWATRQDDAALRALVAPGLVDPDAGVRATAAGALGIAGPGRDVAMEGLLRAVRLDTDAGVRRAAARSVLLLDEEHATARLMDQFSAGDDVFDVYRTHLVETLRRDQSPDRVLAASDELVAARLRPFAVLLVQAASDASGDDVRGRGRVRERLARLYLDEGRSAEAERIARALAGPDSKDDAARDRAELILARALTASGEAQQLREAERRLRALRGTARLDAAADVEAAATLGDCLLRSGDAMGAADVLAVDVRDAPAPVRLRLEQLRADAAQRIDGERRRVLALVDQLAGPDAAAARAALAAAPFSGDAAWHLDRELAGTRDFATVRRLLVAVEVVTGVAPPTLADDASADRVAQVVAAARAALAKVPRAVRTSR